MTGPDTDFDTWFSTLQMHILDLCGIDFTDQDSVKKDYEEGRDVFDVIDEVAAEYGVNGED